MNSEGEDQTGDDRDRREGRAAAVFGHEAAERLARIRADLVSADAGGC